ncbi:MAG: prepilin-type N-terminal cleavage/methylation domain-containing protein [Alphaproteobacteria bacterium]|nr:prepilin-type N-terminal cleavage/methylation domain-containing protein [Alphaproteobacteria bacterium]MCB9792627.1 prepilin-type N-terminal cleavage/methylation domain-containing protein [Alphaproteobacteria bacterium]
MHRPSPQRGFTLIEIVVVLALISVMAAVGFSSVRHLIPRFRMIQVARDLDGDIANLRNTAIGQNRETRLLLVEADESWSEDSSNNAGAWLLQVGNRSINSTRWDTLPADADEDGSDDEVAEGTVDISDGSPDEVHGVSLQPWGSITGPSSSNGDAIVFSPRGWVTNPASDFDSDGYITLTLVNKTAMEQGIDDSISLRIARSGLVRMVTSLGGRS